MLTKTRIVMKSRIAARATRIGCVAVVGLFLGVVLVVNMAVLFAGGNGRRGACVGRGW